MAVYLQDLDFEVIDERESIAEDWRRLELNPCNSLHQSLAWCTAWERANHVQLVYLRGTLNGSCYFILPLEKARHFGATLLQVPAGRYSNLNTGLIHEALAPAQSQAAAARAQQKIAAAIRASGDLLILRNSPLQWRGRESPFWGLPCVENQNQSFQLPLLGSFEQTLSQINAKRRRKKLRISQREAEEAGGYRHCIAQTAEEKRHILTLFFEQKARRFAKQGLPDVFADARIQEFFKQLALSQDIIGQDTALELHYLTLCGKSAGQIIAVTGISRKADHCICQFGSIDEELAGNISPGELLFYHVIESENALGSKLFDFGIGDQRYKRSWCPVTTTQYDIHVPATYLGRLVSRFMRCETSAKATIKNNPIAYRLLQRLRRRKQLSVED